VDSVINQTIGFENIELIIIDDNSNDRTQDILKEFSKKYGNIQIHFLKENSGTPSKPRNIGIENSSSDYIMFLDQDDAYEPGICEKLYKTITKYNTDVVNCNFYNTNLGKKEKSSILNAKSQTINSPNPLIFKSISENYIDLHPSILVWDKIFNKKFIVDNKIKFPDYCAHEDTIFSFIVFMNLKQGIIFLNDFYGYSFNYNEDSESRLIPKHYIFNLIKGLDYFNNFLKSKHINKHDYLLDYLVSVTFSFILNSYTPDINSVKEIYIKFKEYLKNYNLFNRLPVPIYRNIFANILIKLISFNPYFLFFILKTYKIPKMIKNLILELKF
jgi:glycosyltransferase involved in cell wall biosynthesis